MGLRKLMLRVMLLSLALAAAAGAMAMLFFQHEVIWRVVGTTIITAGAAALMMGAAMLADREKTHTTGVVAMGLIVLEFLLALVCVWVIDTGGWEFAERMLATTGWLPAAGLPALFFLRMSEAHTARVAGRTGVAAITLAFLVMMAATWLSEGWSDWEDLTGTGLVIAAFGLTASLALVGVGTDRRHWRYVGVAASLVAAITAIIAIWYDLTSGGGLFSIIATIAVVTALTNVLLFVPLKPGQHWLLYATISAIAACGLFTDAAIISDLNRISGMEELAGRFAGASGILAACGGLALGVLARLNRRMGAEAPVLAEVRQVSLTCPGCDTKQTLPVGDSACPHCGLIFHIRVEEPRCPQCDYVLYMLHSDRCPECGTPVAKISPTAAAA